MAEKRVALVIGNSAYQHVAHLPNPVNDATALASTLQKAGFDWVELLQDLTFNDMRGALRRFADAARDSDVAFIYFAGHGIEVDGNNYLVPIDATLERDTDVYDEAFSLDRIALAIEPARSLRLIVLDACRDNPFSRTIKRTIGSREVTRGLARIEPARPNTLIAYATKAGSIAADGSGKNSPFTSALIKYIVNPGLDLRKAFGFVRDEVLAQTNNQQEPTLFGSLGGKDVSLVSASPIQPPSPQVDIAKAYELALQLGTKDGWNAFLSRYSEGFYVDLAKGQLNKLVANEVPALPKNNPASGAPANALLSAAERIAEAQRPTQADMVSTAAGAESTMIGDVPIPAHLHIVPSPGATEALQQFSGVWVGAWGALLHHILIIEKIELNGDADVVYAVGDNPSANIRHVWLRLHARVMDGALTITAPSHVGPDFTVTYTIASPVTLVAVWQKENSKSATTMTKITPDDLNPQSKTIPWVVSVKPVNNGTADLFDALTNVFSTALASRSPEIRQSQAKLYADAKFNKAQALALGSSSNWYVYARETETQAELSALEGCQIRYNEPCVLAAVNDRVLLSSDSASWTRRTMPRVTFASSFSPEQIPAILPNGNAMNSAKAYLGAASPKAIALHPWGRAFFQTNASTQLQAETDAINQCNSDPVRSGKDGPCFLYAIQNRVVLPSRLTGPHTPANSIGQAAALVSDPAAARSYSALSFNKALTVEPETGAYYWWDGASSKETAQRFALVGCQLAYAKPCILLALNDGLQAADPFSAERHDVSDLHSDGPFSAEKTPLVSAANREIIFGYSKLPSPKALAIRPYHAKAGSATGATVAEAESKALALCNDNPKWPCFLYAVNDRVIVSQRRAEASR
ncbi:caspase domain-containing protein [Bradyrhizobium sp. WSM1417]|uniref:caspase family protein n=1 Tax=Bradyrhizobium sp. WSM1417 TaxID=754500 RepID=UPI0004B07F33